MDYAIWELDNEYKEMGLRKILVSKTRIESNHVKDEWKMKFLWSDMKWVSRENSAVTTVTTLEEIHRTEMSVKSNAEWS
jgi:hypothetical protein